MAWFIIFQWILLMVSVTRLADCQTFKIEPSFVAINESVTFSCYGLLSSQYEAYELVLPNYSDPCTWDCYFNPTCKEDLSIDADCYCDDQNTTIGDNAASVCPEGTENVTFMVFKANENIFGDWGCRFGFDSDPVVAVVNQFLSSSLPELQGNPNITEHAPTTFICASTGGDPPERFYWYRDDGTEEHNLTSYLSDNTLTITPDRMWNGHDIICRVLQLEERMPQEIRVTLSVLFGYTVTIFPCPGEHIALKGTRIKLTCGINEEGNPASGNFVWYKEGITDPVSTEQPYVISDSVAENHQGLYSCQCDNGYDGTPSQTQLVVQYHPEVVSITGDTLVIEGERLELSCSSSAIPDPAYTWTFPNGSNKEAKNIVIPITKIEDAGSYSCTAQNTVEVCGGTGGDTQGSSTTADIRVQYYPRGKPETHIDDLIAVNIKNMLHCNNSTLTQPGDPYPTWIQWYQNASLYKNFTAEEGTSWEFVSLSVNDGGRYSCSCSNLIGASDMSEEVDVTVEAPVTIESYTANTVNPKYDTGMYTGFFNFTCAVSASNIERVKILHNDNAIDDSDFEIAETLKDCKGSCAYDLEYALLVKASWKAASKFFTCDDVRSYDGDYGCIGTATTAGEEAEVTSETIAVETQYSPIWKGESLVKAEIGTENLVIHCDICSNPLPVGYTWYFDDDEIPGAVYQNLTVPYVDESTFGFYYCMVNQEVADKTFIVQLIEQEGTVNTSTGLVVGLTVLLLFLLTAACVMVILVMKGVIKLDCKQSNAHTDDTINHNCNTRSKVNYENTGFVRDDSKGHEKDNRFSDISSEYLELDDSRWKHEVPLDQKTAIHNVLGKHPDGSHDDDYEEFEASGDVNRPQGVTYESLSSTTHQNVPVMNESEKHYQSLQKGTAV